MSTRSLIKLALTAGALVMVTSSMCFTGAASATETLYACAGGPYITAGVMQPFSADGIGYGDSCSTSGFLSLTQDAVNSVVYGGTAGWFAHAPSGLAIERAQVGDINTQGVPGAGYLAQFDWNGYQTCGGSCQISSPAGGGTGTFDTGPENWLNSPDFGWVLACVSSNKSKCPPSTGQNQAWVRIYDVQLTVGEVPGAVALTHGTGLWAQSGWVRGTWPLGFSSSSVSGVCQEAASLNSLGLLDSVDVTGQRNQLAWTQCAAPAYLDPSIDTASFGQGPMPLTLGAIDAAGEDGIQTKTVYVDNSNPTVALSGPTSAPSTAGTQYVTATGGGSLAPVVEIQCSVDGGPTTTYQGATAQIPVSGLGEHTIRCTDEDAAVDAADVHGYSAASATWNLDIAQPTESAIAFSKLIGSLHCRRVRERVDVGARWVTVRRHRKLVKVRRPGHLKLVKVMKCTPRAIKRKITIVVRERRHGKTVLVKRRKVERVVVAPRVVNDATKRVRYGQATTVSGWLGTSSGLALAGRTVDVMTTPNDGRAQWNRAAVVTTDPNGTWTAKLPRGPARLVQAIYAGDSTTEPSTTNTVHLVVPAKVEMNVSPRSTRWGGTIKITGRVLGGYIPSGKLLRLRIGVEGVKETVGIPSIAPDGRFQTTWTFAPGRGVVRYWFSVSTLNEADYPYAPASSPRVYVTVRQR